jgi:hypothetical protein
MTNGPAISDNGMQKRDWEEKPHAAPTGYAR